MLWIVVTRATSSGRLTAESNMSGKTRVSQLGGFLRRKGDGFPGVTVIWRGWQRLQDVLSMWLILDPLIDMDKT